MEKDENVKPQQEGAIPSQEGENIKEKISYKLYDREISVSDQDYIDFYKTGIKMMAMRFMLVGRINDEGIYKISDLIKYDLIDLPKEIHDEDDSKIQARTYYMKKFFYFTVEFSKLENEKAKASLYLSEYVGEFLDKDYIVSHIADFIDDDDENFVGKVKKAYNLLDVAIKVDELKVPNLAVLMQNEYEINMFIGGLYDIAAQIYLMRMLKLLEESGKPECLEIINRYKQLVLISDEKNAGQEVTNKNTLLKALLDRAIDEKGGLESLNLDKEKIKNIVGEINKSIKAIDGLQQGSAGVEILKNESKKAKETGSVPPPMKKVAGKKGKASSSGKSGGGSKSAKPKKKASKPAAKQASSKAESKDKKDKPLYLGNPYKDLPKTYNNIEEVEYISPFNPEDFEFDDKENSQEENAGQNQIEDVLPEDAIVSGINKLNYDAYIENVEETKGKTVEETEEKIVEEVKQEQEKEVATSQIEDNKEMVREKIEAISIEKRSLELENDKIEISSERREIEEIERS